MPRLVLEAVFNGQISKDSSLKLSLTASVSRFDNGMSLTKLTEKNFRATDLRVTGPSGNIDFSLSVIERKWDPSDNEASGIYDIVLTQTPSSLYPLLKGTTYAVGLQVSDSGYFPSPVGHFDGSVGQTVVAVINM